MGKAVSRGSWPHSAVLTMDASATHFKEQEAGCSLSGHHVPSEADGRGHGAARGLWPFRLPARWTPVKAAAPGGEALQQRAGSPGEGNTGWAGWAGWARAAASPDCLAPSRPPSPGPPVTALTDQLARGGTGERVLGRAAGPGGETGWREKELSRSAPTGRARPLSAEHSCLPDRSLLLPMGRPPLALLHATGLTSFLRQLRRA